MVQVVVIATETAIPGLSKAIDALGGEVQGHYGDRLQALVPFAELEALATQPNVLFVREPDRPVVEEVAALDIIVSEGLVPAGISAWHAAGHDGTGVKIAIVDGGYFGYQALLGTELPASVTTYDHTGFGMGTTPHGSAVVEIIHDVAPGGDLHLHRIGTGVEFGMAVDQAISDGVDIMSMSYGYMRGAPGDGTGFYAEIVNKAKTNGIAFFKSAGNNGEVNWAGTFDDLVTTNGTYHAWDGANIWINYIGPGTGTCYILSPGETVIGAAMWDDWTTVDQDFDLHLYHFPVGGSFATRVASSTDPQTGGAGQQPNEFVAYTVTQPGCYGFAVERVNADRDVCLRLVATGARHLDQWVPQGSLSFPGFSRDLMAVAALDKDNPYPLESYSSQGPAYGPGGTCSGGFLKPDIAGYANISTMSYGPGGFNGTSAAAPHVSGAAALVKDAHPDHSVDQVMSFLSKRAIDMGDAGPDTRYGAGRLNLGDPNTPLDVMLYLPLLTK
jgi:subtilisin family serine protease